VPPRPATAPPVATPAPAQSPAPVAPQAAASATNPATAARTLTPAEIAALPFSVDLPAGFSIVRTPAGTDGGVYSVRRGAQTLLMIYAGPASQFPIYDGEQVYAAGRASIVVTEGGRRLALEHLFQHQTAPREIHIWVASVEGADRDLAERIGQSVDLR